MLWAAAAAVQRSGWERLVHVWSSAGHHISSPQRDRALVMALALLALSLLLCRGCSVGCFALVVICDGKAPVFLHATWYDTNTSLLHRYVPGPARAVHIIGVLW